MTGFVYINEVRAGAITRINNEYEFKYYSEYLANYNKPISLTLPLREESYKSKLLFPFFDNLLPEGYLLDMLEKLYNTTDRFILLLKVCQNPIGNVMVREETNND